MNKFKQFNWFVLGMVSILIVAGCESKVLVSTPVADAGGDQAVAKSDTVNLDGSGSVDPNGDPLTYLWSMDPVTGRPAGSTATLSSTTVVAPFFVADLDGVYTITLVVNDGKSNSPTDTVVISVSNTAPVANAGPDQLGVPKNTTVSLDGNSSFDANLLDTLTYNWTFTASPGATPILSDNNSTTAVAPTFLAVLEGTYTITLVVNDATIDSNVDTVNIQTTNTLPVAVAGPDQSLHTGSTVNLDGNGSYDVDVGDSLTYNWTFFSWPGASAPLLSDNTAVTPTFVAADTGTYRIDLIVWDGTDFSIADSVFIVANNAVPIAVVGPDQLSRSGATVQLDGSGSNDTDVTDILTNTWSVLSEPGPGTAVISDMASPTPTITTNVGDDGLYTIQLIVNDGFIDSAPVTMTLTTTANVAPVANIAVTSPPIQKGMTVSLDGNGSTDTNGDVLNYAWSFTADPGAVPALNPSAIDVAPTFVPALSGDYTIDLLVDDGDLNNTATVTITAINDPPIADAGVDQYIALGATATLDGSGSNDPNGDILTETWTITAVPGGSLIPLGIVAGSFVPDVLGAYTIDLVVTDDDNLAFASSTNPETVVVTAIVPVQDTGQTVNYSGAIGDGEDSDYTIFPPSFTDNADGTVTDNGTNLMWQLHDVSVLPTNWFEATGTADATHNPAPAVDVCGSLDLPVGSAYPDWRLPSEKELLYIINYGNTQPAVDGAVFSGIPSVAGHYYFWTVTDLASDNSYGWIVDFSFGDLVFNTKDTDYYVKCVRGAPLAAASYTSAGGIVTDGTTSLIWQQADDGITKDWGSALGYCEGLDFAGAQDWRLPNIKELASASDHTTSGPAAASPPFLTVKSNLYWSSTTDVNTVVNAWGVFFNNGDVGSLNKTGFNYVRCVRGGQ